MTLEALSNTERIALAADWLELAAVLSSRGSSSSADLVRSRAAIEDDEHTLVIVEPDGDERLEEEILANASEQWVSEVREELFIRASSLGESYPFCLVGTGHAWRLVLVAVAERHDHLFYQCCLLISARRHKLVLDNVREMDKVLQVVAYLVAGRVVQGEAYWFGYPRPDSTGMKEAVETLLTKMGFDSPAVTPPIWSVGKENDGGIDIVAWKNFGDNLSSRMVLYGQVASGKNWEDKPVSKEAESVFPSWLGDYGQKYYIPAMFIPWPQYVLVEATRERSFRQRVIETAIRNEKFFGLTIDRGRIAELAGKSVTTGNGDESDLVGYLAKWQEEVVSSLMA